MEREDLAQLSLRIEAAQARLAESMTELRHEAQPSVVAGKAAHAAREKAASFVVTPGGSVRIEAVVAGVVAVAAISAILLFRRRR